MPATASPSVILLALFLLISARSASAQHLPRTSWGHPDLQGTWSTATLTPFERPPELADKPYLTEAEASEFERLTLERTNRDRRDGGAAADVARAYNDFWWDSGTEVVPTRRTSLVIDPPDGRIPPLTAEAQTAAGRACRSAEGRAVRPTIRRIATCGSAASRAVFPTSCCRASTTTTTRSSRRRDYVVILSGDDPRRPHHPARRPSASAPSSVRQWMGDSAGRWEGDTLVVETTNFTDKTNYRGSGENLRLVERFRRTAADILLYQVTIDDPTTFTRPWTVETAGAARTTADLRIRVPRGQLRPRGDPAWRPRGREARGDALKREIAAVSCRRSATTQRQRGTPFAIRWVRNHPRIANTSRSTVGFEFVTRSVPATPPRCGTSSGRRSPPEASRVRTRQPGAWNGLTICST